MGRRVVMAANEAEVVKYMQEDVKSVVYFYSGRDSDSKELAPAFERLSSQYTGLRFIMGDMDGMQLLLQMCNLSACPTFAAVRKMISLDQLMYGDEARLEEFVKKFASA
ncbi:hypothetical protein ABPG75_012222 [Micractinium tetrahymenae]